MIDKLKIHTIEDKEEKQIIVRAVLESLPEWFGIQDAIDKYVTDSAEQITVAAFDERKPIGFVCLKETGKATVELCVMGVLKEYHRQGIGNRMFEETKNIAVLKGYSFIQVKTVRTGKYREYDDTNKFYLRLGFKEFEVFPELWGEENPCQIYIMYIGE